MENFRERIKELRMRSGKSQRDIAKDLGVSQVTVYKLETGKSKITEEYMQKFADIFNTSVSNLLEEDYVPAEDSFNNPKIDLIEATPCCGNGIESEESTIGSFRMPMNYFRRLTYTSPERVKLLQVVGDSMKPTMNDGDFVLVDTSMNDIADGIFVIRNLAGLAVKRIQVGSNYISVISDNPLYKPMNSSLGEIKIIGKVIKIFNIVSV